MEEKAKYLVYRVYSEKERPGENDSSKVKLYGWTTSKKVLKVFFSQRDKNKYKVRKVFDEDLARAFDDTDLPLENLIDFIKLTSASTGEEVCLFITMDELRQVEKSIHSYFRGLCRIVDLYDVRILEMFINLDEYYYDALEFIGFEPPELDAMFDSARYGESTSSEEAIDDLIDEAYSCGSPQETYKRDGKIPGLNMLLKVSDKILYSVESFIMVLKDDM